MATTLMPLDPATSPQRAARVLTVAAHLLPDEVIAARRARKVRGRVIALLIVLVVLLGSWYGYAWSQTNEARDELKGFTADAHALQQRQSRYADVVNMQNETVTINKQLSVLLADDLPWANLLRTLRDTGAGAGIQITGVNGSLASADSSTGGAPVARQLPGATAAAAVGAMTVTGTAPDKPALARYVEALGRLKVVANPYLSSAVDADKRVQFSLSVEITRAALGGRFTKSSTGGK